MNNRIIKFRVWTGKEMIPWEKAWNTETRFAGLDKNQYINLVCAACLARGNNGFTALQFTGLLDKNGKEIYEGDIIKYIYGLNDTRTAAIEYGCYNDGEYVSRVDTYIVKTTQEWPLSDLIHGAEYNYGYAGQVKKNSVQIIGNIFENPKLIK